MSSRLTFGQATFTSAGAGPADWDNVASWTESVGDDADDLPDSDDIVIIQAGHQIDLPVDVTCLDLTVDGTILHTAAGVELRVYGDLTINTGGLINGNSGSFANTDLKISPTVSPATVSLGNGTVISGLDDIIHSPNLATNYTGTGNISVDDRIQLNANSTVTNGSSGTITCNRIFPNGTGTTFNNSSGATINISNDLRLNRNNGAFTNAGTVSVSSIVGGGTSVTIDNSGQITHTGAYTNAGTLTISNDDSGTGGTWNSSAADHSGVLAFNCSVTGNTFIYDLAGDQDVIVPSDGSYYNLTISGSGTKTIAGAINVDNTLDINSGDVDLNSSTLTLGSAIGAPGTLANPTGGDLYNGSFIRYYGTASQSLGDYTGFFPMADTDGNTRPIYINPSTAITGGTITVSVTTSDLASDVNPVITDNGGDIARRHNSSWDVSTTVPDGSYSIRAGGTGFGTIDAVADLRLMTGATVSGTDGGAGGSTSSPTVDRTVVPIGSLASSFHIASVDAAGSSLPVELLSFDANYNFDVVDIEWSTSSETNNEYFIIERSVNGVDFNEIARIEGAGTINDQQDYSSTDSQPLFGDAYYRLKQIDFDGNFEVFNYVKVHSSIEGQYAIYPNPLIENKFNVHFPFDQESVKVQIYNSMGKEIDFVSYESTNGLEILLTQNNPSGLFIVMITSTSGVSQHKLIMR